MEMTFEPSNTAVMITKIMSGFYPRNHERWASNEQVQYSLCSHMHRWREIESHGSLTSATAALTLSSLSDGCVVISTAFLGLLQRTMSYDSVSISSAALMLADCQMEMINKNTGQRSESMSYRVPMCNWINQRRRFCSYMFWVIYVP